MNTENKWINFFRNYGLAMVLCLLFAGIFVTIFSPVTSSISYYYNLGEGAMHLTAGKGWAFHFVPYKDLFDPIGLFPLLLLRQGFLMGNSNKTGFLSIQILFLAMTLLAIWMTARSARKSFFYSFACVALSLVFLYPCYTKGISIEEFVLPFLAWSTYGLYQNLWKKRNHPLWFLLYGITAGVCLMTSGILYLPIILFLFAVLWDIRKDTKTLWKSIGLWIFGLLILTIPFSIYFAMQGCFDSFLEALSFPLQFWKEGNIRNFFSSRYTLRAFLENHLPMYCILIAAIPCLIRKEYRNSVLFILTGILEYIWLTKLPMDYRSGSLNMLTQIVLCMNMFVPFLIEAKQALLKTSFIVIAVLSFAWVSIKDIPIAIRQYTPYSTYIDQGFESLLSYIPSTEYDRFAGYGASSIRKMYMLTNTMSCYSFYSDQETLAKTSPKLKEKIRQEFQEGDALWILTDLSTNTINDVLESKYELIDQEGVYKLYHLKG